MPSEPTCPTCGLPAETACFCGHFDGDSEPSIVVVPLTASVVRLPGGDCAYMLRTDHAWLPVR